MYVCVVVNLCLLWGFFVEEVFDDYVVVFYVDLYWEVSVVDFYFVFLFFGCVVKYVVYVVFEGIDGCVGFCVFDVVFDDDSVVFGGD